jgi:hypothetical protein
MTRQQVAYAGAGLLFVSLFAPLISVPIWGPVTFVRFARGIPGIMMILAVVLATVFAARRSFQWLLVPAGLTASALAWVGWAFVEMKRSMQSRPISRGATDDLFTSGLEAITRGMTEAVQIQWGFGVALLGALLLVVLAFSPTDEEPAVVP